MNVNELNNEKLFKQSLENAEREVSIHLQLNFKYKGVKVSCQYSSDDCDFCTEYKFYTSMSQDDRNMVEAEVYEFLQELNVMKYALNGEVSLS